MVPIVRLGLVLLASAITAQACTYCQCNFQDSSHCCVYSVSSHTQWPPLEPLGRGKKPSKTNKSACSCPPQDAAVGNQDCTAICANAHRADGVSNDDGTAGTACNAGGKYKCISFITAQGRTPCYKQ